MNLKTSLTGFVCAIVFLVSNQASGQVGINTTTPDTNSALDIVDTQKGVLIPRMTQTQANSLAALIPADGILIYNSTAQCVQIYKRTSSTAGAFDCLVVASKNDPTNDAWINDNTTGNKMVKLGTLSDGTTTRPVGTEFVAKDDGKVGIGTSTPTSKLHINDIKATDQYLKVAQFLAPANVASNFNTILRFGVSDSNKNSGDVRFNFKANSDDTNSIDFGFHSIGAPIMSIQAGGNVGVGTNTPTAKLHINGSLQVTNELNVGGNGSISGSAGNAGQLLVSGGAGVAPSWTNPTTAHGDVKLSFMTTDHNGWILLDGRTINTLNSAQRTRATALGFSTNLPNANNAYPVDNGTTVGTVTGSNTKIINQANLPNVNLTATTSTNGNHSHNTQLWEKNSAEVTGGYKFYTRTSSGNIPVTPNTTADGEHSHNVSVALNGGVNQTSFDVTPKSISVKMFVYLGQ